MSLKIKGKRVPDAELAELRNLLREAVFPDSVTPFCGLRDEVLNVKVRLRTDVPPREPSDRFYFKYQ